jgi:hypothetical protein
VNLRSDGRPLRVGHKGAAALAPENTLESLERAVELGCDVVEFDVLALHDGTLVAVPFQVDLEADAGGALAEERKRLVEGRQPGRDRPQLRERHSSDASAPGAVAHFPEIVRVREHERTVVEIVDVELDDVAAELDCPLERLERVLGSKRGGALVADS